MRTLIALTAMFAAATLADAADFVSNGSFESGNVLFSSDYVFHDANLDDLHSAGTYTVDDDPVDNHTAWASFGDHTSGFGHMFIANGSLSSGDEVWHQSVSGLQLGETYTYTVWGASAYSFHPASLKLMVNGDMVVAEALSATTGLWNEVSGTWVATTTSAELYVYDLVSFGDGNDFVLDDISFTGPVPEPATFAALALGFLCLRRKIRA
ncbi:MAG: PEP-CTERM sorting domain-containing protein [Armatimonadetes bacterium]|nr:PEP-CTERM sorting domain-containing protein [Armatimonadota bacterium]